MIHKFFQFFDFKKALLLKQQESWVDNTQHFLHMVLPKKTEHFVQHSLSMQEQEIYMLVQSESILRLWVYDSAQIGQSLVKQRYHILVEQDAQINIHIGLLFASDVEIEFYLYLQGSHAQADLFGVYGLSEQQRCNIKTFQIHEGAHTNSSVTLKGMLKEQARADIAGLIHIGAHAIKTVASQENKNIICDTRAQVKTVPSIEVLQHDVQCFHGAAVGQFDQKHLWSLQSKGLSYHQAYQLLIQSFFGEIVQKFKNSQNFMEMVCKKMM